jgi:hypothetical protein
MYFVVALSLASIISSVALAYSIRGRFKGIQKKAFAFMISLMIVGFCVGYIFRNIQGS